MDGKPCCNPSAEKEAAGDSAAPAIFPSPDPATPDDHWCEIPAGPFTMGTSGPEAWQGDGEDPAREVDVPAWPLSSVTSCHLRAIRVVSMRSTSWTKMTCCQRRNSR